jgi:hypothetical protein
MKRTLNEGEESAMNSTTIGLDIAKNVFQAHGVDAKGNVVLRKVLKRHATIPSSTSRLPPQPHDLSLSGVTTRRHDRWGDQKEPHSAWVVLGFASLTPTELRCPSKCIR